VIQSVNSDIGCRGAACTGHNFSPLAFSVIFSFLSPQEQWYEVKEGLSLRGALATKQSPAKTKIASRSLS
jgi:hypothetical protein